MSIGTLSDIILKVRKLTGSGTSNQLTDSQIIDYINSFYLYDFPAAFRSLKLKDRYTFNTIRGIDTYAFDSEHYTTVEMPCYVAKREVKLFTDPWSFFGVNYNWQFQENLTQGDGSAGPYTGTLQNPNIIRSTLNNPMVETLTQPTTAQLPTPIPLDFQQAIPGRVQNILFTANSSLGSTQNATDDGAGNIIGDATGTINYSTGAVSITFNAVVPSGENIQVQYNPMNPARMAIPLSIMFFQNQFTLRPVPDKGYTVELIAYRQPSQALLGSTDPDQPNLGGTTELNEWWETIAFGAAKKVYEDRLDPDGVALMDKGLQERYTIAEVRTYAQLGKQRVPTMFSDQLQQSYGSGAFGFGNSVSGA
jgi:hypothetical protein